MESVISTWQNEMM